MLTPFTALWLPILVAAVATFVVSSLVHMVLQWHNRDYRRLPDEDTVRAALRSTGAGPGQYVLPYAPDMQSCNTDEMKRKRAEGPVGVVLLRRTGEVAMGPLLGQWFVLTLVVAAVIGALAGTGLAPGATKGVVFQLTGLAGFLAYGTGGVSNAVWMSRPWDAALRDLLDALLYGLAIGASFAWLWPR